ncbi:MAG: hypothetical protein AAF423_09175 [Pseudomonadota bacterium]
MKLISFVVFFLFLCGLANAEVSLKSISFSNQCDGIDGWSAITKASRTGKLSDPIELKFIKPFQVVTRMTPVTETSGSVSISGPLKDDFKGLMLVKIAYGLDESDKTKEEQPVVRLLREEILAEDGCEPAGLPEIDSEIDLFEYNKYHHTLKSSQILEKFHHLFDSSNDNRWLKAFRGRNCKSSALSRLKYFYSQSELNTSFIHPNIAQREISPKILFAKDRDLGPKRITTTRKIDTTSVNQCVVIELNGATSETKFSFEYID